MSDSSFRFFLKLKVNIDTERTTLLTRMFFAYIHVFIPVNIARLVKISDEVVISGPDPITFFSLIHARAVGRPKVPRIYCRRSHYLLFVVMALYILF